MTRYITHQFVLALYESTVDYREFLQFRSPRHKLASFKGLAFSFLLFLSSAFDFLCLFFISFFLSFFLFPTNRLQLESVPTGCLTLVSSLII